MHTYHLSLMYHTVVAKAANCNERCFTLLVLVLIEASMDGLNLVELFYNFVLC